MGIEDENVLKPSEPFPKSCFKNRSSEERDKKTSIPRQTLQDKWEWRAEYISGLKE